MGSSALKFRHNLTSNEVLCCNPVAPVAGDLQQRPCSKELANSKASQNGTKMASFTAHRVAFNLGSLQLPAFEINISVEQLWWRGELLLV